MDSNLVVISYDMHGFNQGLSAFKEIEANISPDIFMAQEHWLAHSNLDKLNTLSDNYLIFGSSAMGLCSHLPRSGKAIWSSSCTNSQEAYRI